MVHDYDAHPHWEFLGAGLVVDWVQPWSLKQHRGSEYLERAWLTASSSASEGLFPVHEALTTRSLQRARRGRTPLWWHGCLHCLVVGRRRDKPHLKHVMCDDVGTNSGKHVEGKPAQTSGSVRCPALNSCGPPPPHLVPAGLY